MSSTARPVSRGWLAETGLGDGVEPTEQDLARAVDFREGLRSLLLANNGVDAGDDSADRLNAALDGASSEVRFQGSSAEIVPTCGNVDGALATMALSRPRSDAERRMGQAQGMPGRRLPLGVLRSLAEPFADLVPDGRLRQPRQGSGVPGPQTGLIHRFSVPPRRGLVSLASERRAVPKTSTRGICGIRSPSSRAGPRTKRWSSSAARAPT